MRFLFKLLQLVVNGESLGNPENWDHFLTTLSLRPPHLLQDSDFLPQSAFRDSLASSSGDAVARAAVVTVCRNFLVNLCQRLQASPFALNSLARGLSSFDPEEVVEGLEIVQMRSFQELLVTVERHGWSPQADNPTLVEAYRAFLGSLRANRARYDGTGAFRFIADREELHVNRDLHSLFCLVSLYSIRGEQTFPEVEISLPGSSLSPHTIRTMARVVQSYLMMDPDVASHLASTDFLNGLSQTFRTVRSSFSQVRFSPWTAILRSSQGLIRDRLRGAFDQMVARQEQSPSFRRVTRQANFSVPDHIVRSPGGQRRAVSIASVPPSAIVSESAPPESSTLPSTTSSSAVGPSLEAEGDRSASVAGTSVVSEPVRPHTRRLPAARAATSSQISLFSRVAYKTARGRGRRLIYRCIESEDESDGASD